MITASALCDSGIPTPGFSCQPLMDPPLTNELEASSNSQTVEGIPSEDHVSTWAQRNPLKEIIPPRKNAQPKKSASQKELEAKNRELAREKSERMNQDIKALLDTLDEGIEKIANEYSKPLKAVSQLVKQTTRFVKSRAACVRNAVVSAKSKELNKGTLSR